jgi:hypothetical protein
VTGADTGAGAVTGAVTDAVTEANIEDGVPEVTFEGAHLRKDVREGGSRKLT